MWRKRRSPTGSWNRWAESHINRYDPENGKKGMGTSKAGVLIPFFILALFDLFCEFMH